MIGVGYQTKKNTVKVLERFSGSEMDTAVELAQELARHNRGEYLVFLIYGDKYKILKRVGKGLRLNFPTLRHPLRFPHIGVITK